MDEWNARNGFKTHRLMAPAAAPGGLGMGRRITADDSNSALEKRALHGSAVCGTGLICWSPRPTPVRSAQGAPFLAHHRTPAYDKSCSSGSWQKTSPIGNELRCPVSYRRPVPTCHAHRRQPWGDSTPVRQRRQPRSVRILSTAAPRSGALSISVPSKSKSTAWVF